MNDFKPFPIIASTLNAVIFNWVVTLSLRGHVTICRDIFCCYNGRLLYQFFLGLPLFLM